MRVRPSLSQTHRKWLRVAMVVGKGRLTYIGVLAVVSSLGTSLSHAAVVTLVDNNSTAQIETSTAIGMFNWFVDGQDQLAQQWFWYRVGGSGPEAPINTISVPAITSSDARSLDVRYDKGSYSVEVNYVLTGFATGSGASDMTESITISNASSSPLDFHFFQYSDFDLGVGGDSVMLLKDLAGLFTQALQTGSSGVLQEAVVTPGAVHGEAGFFPLTLNRLNDSSPTVLNDVANAGPGDVTWALQWDFSIAPGGSVGISKTKSLQLESQVPEPATLALFGIALAGLGFSRRKPSLIRNVFHHAA